MSNVVSALRRTFITLVVSPAKAGRYVLSYRWPATWGPRRPFYV